MNLTFDNLDELDAFLCWAEKYRPKSSFSGCAVGPLPASAGDVAFDTPQSPLQVNHVSIGAGLTTETKVYTDGTTVTGAAPLPDLSPAQQGESKGAEPAKRKRRTKAEIEADVKAEADAAAAAAEAAKAGTSEPAAPTGANPFEAAPPDTPHPGNEAAATEDAATDTEAVVTPFQHLTRAREFIAKHGMPKYNESFSKAGLDANVMGYSAFQRALHMTALDELEQA